MSDPAGLKSAGVHGLRGEPPLQGQRLRFGRGPPLQGQKLRFGWGPPLQGDFVRRVVPRPAPTRGRGTSMYRSDEIPLQRRPSRSWCSPLRRALPSASPSRHRRSHGHPGGERRGGAGIGRKQAMNGLRSPVGARDGATRRCARSPHCRGSPRSRQTPALFKLAESGIPRLSEEPSKNAFGDLPGDAIDRLPNAMVGPRAAWCRFRWPRPHAHNRRSIRPRSPPDRREHPGWRTPARPASIRFATPFATGATQARNRGVALRWIPPGNCGGGCPPC